MDKLSLRNQLLEQRQALPSNDAQYMSTQIARRVQAAVDWSAVKTVHAYRSNMAWNEVDTSWLVSYVDENWPHISLTVGLATKAASLPSGSFDLVIVPLVGFDTRLHRLGHGGGWYDKFLATQPAAIKIGLGYDMQRVPQLPNETHDISLDMVVTENNVFTK